ncbi:MAG: pseudouridine synthase [Candidatus Tyloplasma litorale]|nr:MAG: pseudouridine synthase [Mycoplasmatales bacterium]
MKFKFNSEDKMRLDKFISMETNLISREKIKKYIIAGKVKINDLIVVKPKTFLKNGDLIKINIQESSNQDLKKWENQNLPKIIFECKDYLIIDKPSGLVVHPGIGNQDKTLVNILIAHENLELSMKNTNRPGIVHRLDKNTSGLMIIAKNDKFHNYISNEFAKGNVSKVYDLITNGKYKSKKGLIDAPIGRNPNNRKLMKVTLENSKPAKSIFKVKESFKNNEYVEFKILTGRTHQIRVHSKFIGAPVLNDPEYANNFHNKEFGQYLHCRELSFFDMKGKKVIYNIPLNDEMIEKLKELRGLK